MSASSLAVDFSDLAALEIVIGQPLGISRWFEIQQDDIDAFGILTEDRDAMHMDPEWAAENSPFGGTIAYGFQTLSMMTAMVNDILPRGSREAYKINYGFDRIRLMAPVRAGKRIRGAAQLKSLRAREDDSHIVTITLTVEIEGETRPAAICDWLFIVANSDARARRPDMPVKAV
ncbi:MaoC family dehydratase [Algihabitans albus]|uniref:MaoC family dehydratase n=1 Tax=Algihabitans albus TaxID=2164067 RepID=UPI000E5CD848|nr:MaoC family dehydratase [Algihabitans albus]